MEENINILNDIFSKVNKLYFSLFLFIVIYLGINWTNLFVENTDLNILRNEKNNLDNIIISLDNLNNDFLNLCNMGYIEKEKITQLKFFFEYIKNETSVSVENAADLENTIIFLRYIIDYSFKIGTFNTTLDSSRNEITISEILTFSENFDYYKDFTNNISLINEIRITAKEYDNFTKNQKSKIIGGEDIFLGITNSFGENLQRINNLDSHFKANLSTQANALFYTLEDFNNLTLNQIKTLNTNYNFYIEESLKNTMTKRDMIPLINLTVDRSFFRKVLLLLISLVSFLLIIETIKLKKLDLSFNLLEYNHSLILFLFYPKSIANTYSIYEKLFLYIWSIVNLTLPILILIAYFLINVTSTFETILLLLFCILYYSWLKFYFTLINSN